MIIEKNHASILIYETINGYLFQRQYIGYSETEAKKLFKKDAKNESKKGQK